MRAEAGCILKARSSKRDRVRFSGMTSTVRLPGPAAIALAVIAAAGGALSVQAADASALRPRAHVAADGHLAGRVVGLPAAGELRFASALAVDADSAEATAAGPVSRSHYSLATAPGPYVAAVEAEDASRAYRGFGAAVTVSAGAVSNAKVTVRPVSAAAAAARAAASGGETFGAPPSFLFGTPPASEPRARESASPGAVYTMGSITLDAARGARIPSYQLSDYVLRAILDPCMAAGTRFVETSPAVVAFIRREQQLSDEGRLDTKIHYQPLHAQYSVTGHGTASAKGAVTLELVLTDLSTGQVVAHQSVSGKVKQLPALIDQLTAAFAASDCTPPPPEPVPILTPVEPVTSAPATPTTPTTPETGTVVSPPVVTPEEEEQEEAERKGCPDAAGLRAAAAATEATVTLDAGCHVELTEPVVVAGGHALTIDGAAGATIMAEEEVETSLFTVDSGGSLTLEGVTLQDGTALGGDGESGGVGAQGEPGAPGPSGGEGGVGEAGQTGASGEDGGDGQGGAVDNAGTLRVIDCVLNGNSAFGGVGGEGGMGGLGGPGGDGGEGARGSTAKGGAGGKGGKGGDGGDAGDGGAGQGGAIYNATGASLTIESSTFAGNVANGGFGGEGGEAGVGGAGGYGGTGGEGAAGAEGNPGNGGNGKVGGEGGTGGDGNDGGDGADGGTGGAGQGGAIYNAGEMSVSDTRFVSNGAVGLDGGAGGDSDLGGTGGTGGSGGRGGAGGNGHCPLENGLETNCGASGGNGANGANGGTGGDGGDVSDGGDNGDGGDAQGGAIYTSRNTLAELEGDGDTFLENLLTPGAVSGLNCQNTINGELPEFDCPGLGEFSRGPSTPGEGGLGGPEGQAGYHGNGGHNGKLGEKPGAKGAEGAIGMFGHDGNTGKKGEADGPNVYTASA